MNEGYPGQLGRRDHTKHGKTASFAHLDFSDARQPLQAVCWRQDFLSSKLIAERVHLITNLPPSTVTGAQTADWIRGH